MKTRFKTTFRSLRYRNYRLFFTGQTVSLIGTWIQKIALPWLVYRLTQDAFLLGVVGFAEQIPTFLLAPFAGVMVDRWDRYKILLATQIFAALQAATLTILFFTGTIAVWHIILLGIVLGIINAFDMPARQTFVVDMVENNEDKSNAIALNSSMVNSARLLGPSIAGILVATAGEGTCFLLNAISFIFVIISLLMMKNISKKGRGKDVQILQEFKDGLSYVWGSLPLRSIILLLALVSLMGISYGILMPVFAKDVLHGSSRTFGFLTGASGVGALTGALYLASRKNVKGLIKMIPLSAAVFGAGLVAFSLSKILWLSLALMFITGFGMIMQMAASNTILQTIADEDKRGRVMSFFTMSFMGTTPFGSLLAGALSRRFGPTITLAIGGASCVLGAVIFAIKLPDLRKAIRPIYVRLGIISET